MKSFVSRFISTIPIAVSFIFFILIFSCKKDKGKNYPESYLDYPGFPMEGLIAYYPLNGDGKDYSGNDRHAYLYSVTATSDRFGSSKNALHFNGENSFIEIQNFPELNESSGTICFWARIRDGLKDTAYAVISKSDASGAGYVISAFGNLGFYFLIANDIGSVHETRMSDYFIMNENFYFYAISFTEDTRYLYFDGYNTRITTSGSVYYFNNYTQPLYIGKSNRMNPSYSDFEGDIDDILIYNRVLTDEEILHLSMSKINH